MTTGPGRGEDTRFYGRRSAHGLSPNQARLLREVLPRLRVAADDPRLAEPARLFPVPVREVWLEIGFGGGEHLAGLAETHPDCGLLGVEPFVNGVAKLLALVDRGGLANVAIHDDDARALLPAIGPASLARVYLLYPDPWPKARHRRRRFVNPANLAQLHRILKPGGTFHFATDIADYARWTLTALRRHGGFDWLAEGPDDWRRPWPGWTGTRYEAKAVREGRLPTYLVFRRR